MSGILDLLEDHFNNSPPAPSAASGDLPLDMSLGADQMQGPQPTTQAAQQSAGQAAQQAQATIQPVNTKYGNQVPLPPVQPTVPQAAPVIAPAQPVPPQLSQAPVAVSKSNIDPAALYPLLQTVTSYRQKQLQDNINQALAKLKGKQ
jgi:hypothetical protein